jgi:hypothetical protein
MVMRHIVFNMQLDQLLPVIFLYVGPETILPLTSFLAAIVGILLMVWHRVFGFVRVVWNACFKKSQPSTQSSVSADVAEPKGQA